MLVLRRAVSEQIFIDVGNVRIRLQVIDIQGQRTRIGIDAPSSVKVVRAELETERTKIEGLPESPRPLIRIGDELQEVKP